jgi:hypothetical protein
VLDIGDLFGVDIEVGTALGEYRESAIVMAAVRARL